MAKFVLNNFCFCLDLYVGSLIIGYLNVVGSIWGIHIFSTNELISIYYVNFYIIATFCSLLFSLLLAFNIMLLVGLYQNKPTYVKISAIYHCVFLMGSLILCIVTFMLGPFVTSIVALFCIISRKLRILYPKNAVDEHVEVFKRRVDSLLQVSAFNILDFIATPSVPGIYFVLVLRSYYYKMMEKSMDNNRPTLEMDNNKQ